MFRRKNRQPKPKFGDLRFELRPYVEAQTFQVMYVAEVQRYGCDDYGISGWYPHGGYTYRSFDPTVAAENAKAAIEALMGLERPKIIRVP